MNKNEIFRKFIENPQVKDYTKLTDSQLKRLDLYSESPNRLIDVIKTTVMNLENDQSVDVIARKINQSFKRETI